MSVDPVQPLNEICLENVFPDQQAFSKMLLDRQAEEIPEEFSLDQNYPNPFNPTTSIRFGLPESGPVRVVVHDVLGRVVRQLVDGDYNAGWHTVRFDAGNLASGIYFYRIETRLGAQVRQMVVSK